MRRLPMLLSVATMVAMAAPAHADNTDGGNGTDQAFLAALNQAGLTYQDPDRAVAAGKKVCDLVNGGMAAVDVVKNLEQYNPGFAGDGAAKFTGIAAEAYCPAALARARQDASLAALGR
ncbi:DUF732 domain-containing protein [Mycobacterium sp. IS-1264]|uniref:DUF732 domain-containing protein n=1 Tax=Mycobacterium sp. IS-1264 TaxID=1834158 RepID=UPI00096EF52E|nr:DUF732 domain-containing protein [Mycobacterium sp. IS-1264]